MFDSLLGKKFTGKCKHSIKCINTRILPIRKKKEAMLRFLKKDVADLIANGLDDKAFARMDALTVETNHASCYDIIEQYCEYISIQLPSLQKQRECPEEAMEAVSTLIFAAARFSDLPELCDLRHVFTERYGSHMESSVNAEFVEKMQKKSFPMNKKLRLMQDIAHDFSVTWDSKAFEQKLCDPVPAADRPKKGTPICNGSKEPAHRSNGSKGTPICDGNNEPAHVNNGRKGNGYNKPSQMSSGRKEADIDMHNEEIPCKGRSEATPRSITQKQVQPQPRNIHIVSSISNGHPQDHAEKTRKVFIDEPENVEPCYTNAAVPPYIKPKERQNGSQKDNQLNEDIARNRSPWAQEGPGLIGLAREAVGAVKTRDGSAASVVPPYTKSKGSRTGVYAEGQHDNRYIYDRSPRAAEEGLDPRDQERQPIRPVKSNNDRAVNMIPPYIKPKVTDQTDRSNGGDHKDPLKDGLLGDEQPIRLVNSNNDRAVNMIPPYVKSKVNNLVAHDRANGGEYKDPKDELLDNERPKPVSVRRKHTKPPVVSEINTVIDDDGTPVSRTPSGRRKGGRRSSATNDDDYAEGEKIRDREPKLAVRDEVDGAVDYGRHVNRTPSGRRRHGGRQIAGATYDGDCEDDDEEKFMDRLLVHYSKKGMENESSKMRTRTRAPPAELVVDAVRCVEHHGDGKIHLGAKKSVHPPGRAASFPPEPISPTKAVKGPTRAASMQPEMLSPNGGRVHPRLPDYDELAARFMALKKV